MSSVAAWFKQGLFFVGIVLLILLGLLLVPLVVIVMRPLLMISLLIAGVAGLILSWLSPRFRRWVDTVAR